RADRRARIVARRLLLDRDGRRQPFDQVDVGLLHQLQELPGVGRERLDIAALALRVEGVERERGLARTRQAGDHHEAFARNVEADVLEVVRAGAADSDCFHLSGARPPEATERRHWWQRARHWWQRAIASVGVVSFRLQGCGDLARGLARPG